MEYAAGGELFERICNAGIFSEDEARYFFQQLISGVSFCHAMQICHRDLKLENTFLDGSPAPILKTCDVGYSKFSVLLHSRPKSRVRTRADIAPEVLCVGKYDRKMADVWSCGVTLYVMLVGAFPFEDPEDPKNFRKTTSRIMNVQYKIPDYIDISPDCRRLLSCIFVASPSRRITIKEIKSHPWFLKNLPRELTEAAQAKYYYRKEIQSLPQGLNEAAQAKYRKDNPSFSPQSAEEIMRIVEEAKRQAPPSHYRWSSGREEEEDGDPKEEDAEEGDEEEEDDEYDKRVKEVHASGEVHVNINIRFSVAV
ncbi:hypothetical protein BT93_L4065 [Corymbia citriodora subsp. variegata]|uniref:non-specific serine/threonine protein kinase n=1 Tax=Corymbia citriodora subsp. variegata TaxID=360336 RepID=A0A8T0CIG5_CORYI|nr:hypothetical protein BT93_L4065 [Corymbia citriodora subsp. variegata]